MKQNEKKFSFSKLIIALVMFSYFIALYVAIDISYKLLYVHPEHTAAILAGLFVFVAAPVGVAIALYSWKAKHENVAEINKHEENIEENLEDTINDN